MTTVGSASARFREARARTFKLLLTSGPDGNEVLLALVAAVLRPKVPIAKVTVLNPEATCQTNGESDLIAWQMLYASGVNTPTLQLPGAVSLDLHKGDQRALQMHLLNASKHAVTGTASLFVTEWPAGRSRPRRR